MGNKCCGPAGQTAGGNAPSELPSSSGIGSHALRESYVIERQIGKGHYGRVYKGRHRDTGNSVAIKILDRRKSRPHRLKLEHTARNHSATLQVSILEHVGYHRNVVQLLDHFEDAANVELVFELMEGGELFERLLSKGPYKEARALVIVKHLTDALHFIHAKGIVHRDLKPENLLLDTQNDKTSVVKLADFGLSTQLTDGETHMGTVCGTWAYSAPEVRINRQRYTKKVDAWSLGVITFVLLSGYHPFDPDGVAPEEELQRNIKYGTFDFDDPAWERVSAAAKDLVRRLLVTDPRRRYGTEDVLAHPWITKNAHLWRESPPRPANSGGSAVGAGSPAGGGPKDSENGTREAESTGYASHSSVQASGFASGAVEPGPQVAATTTAQSATNATTTAAGAAPMEQHTQSHHDMSADRPDGPMQIEAGTSDHEDALIAAAAVTAQAAAYASSPPLQAADEGMLPQANSTLSVETPPTVRAASAASAAPGAEQIALHPRMDTYDSEHFVSKNTEKSESVSAAAAADPSALGTTVSDLGHLSLGGGVGGVDLNTSTGAVHPAAAAAEESSTSIGASGADGVDSTVVGGGGNGASPALRSAGSGLALSTPAADTPEFDAIQVGPVQTPGGAAGGQA